MDASTRAQINREIVDASSQADEERIRKLSKELHDADKPKSKPRKSSNSPTNKREPRNGRQDGNGQQEGNNPDT